MNPTAGSGPNVRRALATAFLNRYSVLAINLTATLTLARLVTPAETGMFSVTASIILLAQALRDFGISEFLVQERDLTPEKIRTAFGTTLILAWSLGLLVFLARDWIAAIYGTPELGQLIAIASGAFLVAPISSTVMALLNRDMAFGVMLRISVSSNLVNAAVSVSLAFLGWGATALTLGMLAMSVTTSAVAALSCQSWNHFIPSVRAWRQIAHFGVFVSGVNVVNQIAGRAPDLIIGNVLGFNAVGLFNRGGGTVRLFNDLVTSSVQAVVFPALSAIRRRGENVREPYLRVISLITGAVIPLLAFVAVIADPLVRVLLGTQWLAAIPLIPLFALAVIVESLCPMANVVLTATGKVSFMLRIAAIQSVAQITAIGLFCQVGLVWIVAGKVLCSALAFVLNVQALRRVIGVSVRDLFRATSRSIGLAAWTVVAPAMMDAWLLRATGPAWLRLLTACALAGVLWTSGIFVLRHPLREEAIITLRAVLALARRNMGVERA
ncbi:MAG: lipopolysaccharide biosynthesis protein [Acetobacteraceae bacterium]